MFSDTLISPKSDQSIRTRFANIKRRPDSPNFRDILRQRCRDRVKAKRTQLFDHFRALQDQETVRDAISQFIEMDLDEIKSLDPSKLSNGFEDVCMDEVEDAPLSQLAFTDQERWILEEYDRHIEMTNAQAELADVVTCPMCSHGILQLDYSKQLITCTLCSLLLPQTTSLPELEQRIVMAVDGHGRSCKEQPSFTICPEGSSANLLLLCLECGQCLQII